MVEFRVLVVDDQGPNVEATYGRLFQGDASFHWEMAQSKQAFEKEAFESFDAVLLDINLDQWNMLLGEAVNTVGKQCPIVLVSQYWGEPTTHTRVEEVLALAKQVQFVRILILNDLVTDGWQKRVRAMREQLRLAIARDRRRGVLHLPSDAPIHILHLSDPQYGDPGEDGWAVQVEGEIAKSLRDIQPNIHFIAITGDISFQGHPNEFRIAEEKLGSLLTALLPNREDWRERVLLVPGNHDVNLRLAAADQITVNVREKKLSRSNPKTVPADHRRYALQPFREFAWRLTGDPNWRDSEDLCWVNDSFRHLGLRFYLLNSAAAIHCADPKTAKTPSLELLTRSFDSVAKLFGIALSHHGPASAGTGPIEALSNWPDVAKHLQLGGIRLFLHGHGHAWLAERFPLGALPTTPSEGRLTEEEVLRIMAPTTHLNDKMRPDGAHRGFTIITLRRSNAMVHKAEVDSYKLHEGSPLPMERKSFSL